MSLACCEDVPYFMTEDVVRVDGDSLVWSSEVKIEVLSDGNSSIFDVHPEKSKQNTDVTRLSQDSSRSTASTSGTASSTSAEDADDEGSICVRSPSSESCMQSCLGHRGRSRIRTAQLRRRGIELSRDDLKLPPPSCVIERQSASHSRAVHDQPFATHSVEEQLSCRYVPRNTNNRQIIEDVRNIKRQLAGNLRSSISRRRSDSLQANGAQTAVSGNEVGDEQPQHKWLKNRRDPENVYSAMCRSDPDACQWFSTPSKLFCMVGR